MSESESVERVAYADVLLDAISDHEKELSHLSSRLEKELRLADRLIQRLLILERRLELLEQKTKPVTDGSSSSLGKFRSIIKREER